MSIMQGYVRMAGDMCCFFEALGPLVECRVNFRVTGSSKTHACVAKKAGRRREKAQGGRRKTAEGGTWTSQCTSFKGLMVSIRWYLVCLKG